FAGTDRCRRDLWEYLDEGINDQWVVHPSTPFTQNLERLLIRQAWTIRAIRGQRIEAINHRQDARAERDIVAAEFRRVASAIPIFVMVPNDWNNRVGKAD